MGLAQTQPSLTSEHLAAFGAAFSFYCTVAHDLADELGSPAASSTTNWTCCCAPSRKFCELATPIYSQHKPSCEPERSLVLPPARACVVTVACAGAGCPLAG